MPDAIGLGRVVVMDVGEGGRRVLRAIRELSRLGLAQTAIAVHGPLGRHAAYLREADAILEAEDRRQALASAQPDTLWIGMVSPAVRLELAAWCAENGVRLVGPGAEVIRRTTGEGLVALAREVGAVLADPTTLPGARQLEAVVARDSAGGSRVVGLGEVSLQLGEVVLVAESVGRERWGDWEREAAELGARACRAAGWVGVAAVRLAVDNSGRQSLAGLEPFARTAPAIEAASGVDLTRLSLTLAAGEAVGSVASSGAAHAVAARIVPREVGGDPRGGGGRVERLRLPADPALRAEAEVDEGDLCGPGEPVATVVALGHNRTEALSRLAQALEDSDVLVGGRGTTKAWVAALCSHSQVLSGAERMADLAGAGDKLVPSRPEVALVAAALEVYDLDLALERQRFLAEARRGRPRVGPSSGRVAELRLDGQRHRLEVRQVGPASYQVVPAGGAPLEVRVERLADRERRLVLGDRRTRVLSSVDGLRHLVEVDGVPHVIQREPAGLVVAPLPSVVVAIPVHVGQRIAAGDPVARVESMKVEIVVTAPSAGVIREVVAVPNAQVDAGTPLVRLESDDAEPASEPTGPLALVAPAAPPTLPPRERYLAALDELRRVLLGFDVAPAQSRRLAAGWAQLSASVVSDDPEVLAAEEAALSAFADL
ncbi:MAG TPA: biotin/lipoyl-containing protein, partial [Anaeromyxobacter sp.]|nr:biotin/lipoyl-containing protein [Anaeromyxobacter sp.]